MNAGRAILKQMSNFGPRVRLFAFTIAAIAMAGCTEMYPWVEGGHKGESAPVLSFTVDEASDRIVIQSASSQADWNRLALEAKGCETRPTAAAIVYSGGSSAATVRPNVAADRTGAPLNEPGATCSVASRKDFGPDAAPVNAGDFLAFCATPDNAAVAEVRITMFDTVANAVVHVVTFDSVAPCDGR